MGTDWLTLFDKGLADRVLAMDDSALEAFVDANPSILTEGPLGWGDNSRHPTRESIRHALLEEYTRETLVAAIAEWVAKGREELYLDYWACFAEVFSGRHPPGSISSREYLPHETEERFILLRPEHLDQMLDSLARHRSEVRIMTPEAIRKLAGWRDRCRSEAGLMAAYFLDY